MKQTKTFCDICKEEIPGHIHQSVAMCGHVDMHSGMCNTVDLEVCRRCGVEFFILLEKLKEHVKNTVEAE